jgi:C1A family cysteine protease
MLATKGPLSVCVNATPWQDYTSGVMSTGCSSDASSIDHCVQLVGYTSSYWIVRNSWNTDWGNGGFIYLGIGSNVCGIADQVTYVTV